MTLFIILPISRLNEPNTSENQKIDSNLTSRWLEPILLKVLERSEPRLAIEGSMWGSSQMGSRDVWKSNRNHIMRLNWDEGDGIAGGLTLIVCQVVWDEGGVTRREFQ